MLRAAFSVKVMASMRDGGTPASITSRRKSSTSTSVLPEPGPAVTHASCIALVTSTA
jgi:hypothetical protein